MQDLSSPIRDQTRALAVEAWSLNPWTTGEVPKQQFLSFIVCLRMEMRNEKRSGPSDRQRQGPSQRSVCWAGSSYRHECLGWAWQSLDTQGSRQRGSYWTCLAAFSYLEEMLTSRTLEVPHCSLARTEQAEDRYDQCCIMLGPGEGLGPHLWP